MPDLRRKPNGSRLIIMPVVNGFGVLEYMKKKGLLDRLPVVIVTDDDSEETSDRAFESDTCNCQPRPHVY